MSNKVITILDVSGSRPRMMFPAPADKYAARSLWVFLVDNLKPGFVVGLSINDSEGESMSELTRPSGRKVPIELYESLMEGQETV